MIQIYSPLIHGLTMSGLRRVACGEWLVIKVDVRCRVNTHSVIPQPKHHCATMSTSKSAVSASLSDEQLAFATSPIQSARLIGNPGCGKTRSIIEFINHKHNMPGELKLGGDGFIIVTFSKMAQLDFLAKGKASRYGKLYTAKNVRTIHSMAYSIYTQSTNSTSKFLNTIVLAAAKVLQKHNHASQTNGTSPTGDESGVLNLSAWSNCKVIVVDEAQDVSDSQYDFVMQLAKAVGAVVIMVGDPNQNIFQFQGGSDRWLLSHPGAQFNLTTNYRSTPTIVNLLNPLRPHKDLPAMTHAYTASDALAADSDPQFAKPVLFGGRPSEILAYMVSVIKTATDAGVPLSDIAVIGSVRKSREGYKSIGLSSAVHALSDAGIKCVEHYGDCGKVSTGAKKARQPDHVNILTCHASKGLEFHTVIVINYHLTTFTRLPTKQQYDEHCYLWYVALSRAKKDMHILVSTEKKVHPSIALADVRASCTPAGATTVVTHPKDTKFSIDSPPPVYHVKDIVTDNKYFSPEVYFKLQEIQSVHQSQYSPPRDKALQSADGANICVEFTPEDLQTYSALYGEVMEVVFNAEMDMHAATIEQQIERAIAFLTKLLNSFRQILVLDSRLENSLTALKIKGIFMGGKISYRSAKRYYAKANANEREILRSVITHCEAMAAKVDPFNNMYASCEVMISNNAQVCDVEIVRRIYQNAIQQLQSTQQPQDSSTDNIRRIVFDAIFDIVLYRYAFTMERKSWVAHLGGGMSEAARAEAVAKWQRQKDELFSYMVNVQTCAKLMLAVGKDFRHNQSLEHPLLPIVGEADSLFTHVESNQQHVLELKFTGELTAEHIAQCMIYLMCAERHNATPHNATAWLVNLKTCEIHRIELVEHNRWSTEVVLARAIGQPQHQPIFVLDLETNSKPQAGGLTPKFPVISKDEIEIIDHHIMELTTGAVVSTGLVQNQWPITNAHIHGITDQLIKTQGAMTKKELAAVFNTITTEADSPTLIAHNGNGFDFKVLRELGLVNPAAFDEDRNAAADTTGALRWVDSMNLLRVAVKLADPKADSMRLEDLYRKWIDPDYVQTHRAAEDVEMIVKLFQRFDIDHKFVITQVNTV